MKSIKFLLLFTLSAFIISSCGKDDDNNDDDDADACLRVNCRNSGVCEYGDCICATDWMGRLCDSSSVLPPYLGSYDVVSTSSCSNQTLKVMFSLPKNATNPRLARFALNIACNFGNDNVVIMDATFDGDNFTTTTRECRYNSQTEQTHRSTGYFTADSLFFTLYSTYLGAADETCTYAGKR